MKDRLHNIFSAVLIFAAATGIGYAFHAVNFSDTNIALIYLLAVLIIVWLTRSLPAGLLAAIGGTFAFNYFFAAPRFTFTVYDPNYYITFITLTFTAVATGILTARAQEEARLAREKEAETKAIYTLTNKLAGAKDLDEIVDISVSAISDALQCNAGFLCFDSVGHPDSMYVLHNYKDKTNTKIDTDNPDLLKFHLNKMKGDYIENGEYIDRPIHGRDSVLGLIRISTEDAKNIDPSGLRLLHSMIDSISLAMDRLYSAQQRMKSIQEASRERYRANLLRSISHDIRTPLTGITGMSEMLADTIPSDNEYCMGLAVKIRKNAEWLHSLVENILNMTRLQDGTIKLRREIVPVEEVIGVAIDHVEDHRPDLDIEAKIPEEVIMAPMDPKLIEQVLINLLENAIKHIKADDRIWVSVSKDDDANEVIFKVEDSGEGIDAKDLPYIFQEFYSADRLKSSDHGFGLGLAICETIISAHNGRISAANREEGRGAVFSFALPVEEKDEL